MQTRVSIIIYISLDPRPIRLQLNTRSPPRPVLIVSGRVSGHACAVVAVVAQVFAQKERIPEQGGANRNTNSVCISILTP